MKKRITAFLLMIAIIVSMFPIITVEPEEVNAGMVYIEGLGNVELKYDGKNGYKIYLDEEKNLIVTGIYHHNSSATLSYHTSVLYFASRNSGGAPGGLAANECFPVGVEERHETVIAGSNSLVTYTVYRSELEDMITYLFGADGLKTEQKVYMSEGFRLTKRDSTSDTTWDRYGEVYSSLSGIRGAASWSGTTYDNFKYYYDIALTLELKKYNITVEAGEGGSVGQSHAEAYAGDDVTINAYPDEGYRFLYWSLEEGIIPGFNTTSAESSFVMPACDVVIKAIFEAKNNPPATRKPSPTMGGSGTPVPTATPTPAPTPTPPYMPEESTEEIQKSVRYYSTDAGYSIGGIYNKTVSPQDDAFGYVGTNGSGNKGYSFEASMYTDNGDYSYSVGTDDEGNTWYFNPDGTNATFVHPKVYNGYDVDTADVRYITELTFPSTIVWNGTTYAVTSIGGGTDMYCGTGSERDGTAWFGEWSSSYNSYEEFINEIYTGEGLRQYYSQMLEGRKLGVIGNGSIWSSYFLHQFYSNNTNEHFEFENSYYVYNTTLRYVTIPDTVTRIEDFAFSGCQALVKIIGGAGVTDIGDNAFDAIGTQTLKTSIAKQNSSGSITSYEHYYYNGSFSYGTPTTTMQAWKNSVVLSDYMEFPAFDSLKNMGVSSFEKRANLDIVSLPITLVEIGANAFKDCVLDKITVPAKTTTIGTLLRPSRASDRTNTTPEQTLGTKGNTVVNKTLIVTEPYAEAMDYGLLYEDYYDLRAGYAVTYHNNSTPVETYLSKPSVKRLHKELKERAKVFAYDTNENVLEAAEVLLDTEGGLWLDNGERMPIACLPDLKFDNIYAFEVKESDSNDTTGVNHLKYCLAFAENGTVWIYRPEEAVWTWLGVSEGSSGVVMNKSTYGAGGAFGAETKELLTLYFLDEWGSLYSKPVYRQDTKTIYYPEGTTYYFEYTLYVEAQKTAIDMPNGVTFVSFDVEENTASPDAEFRILPVIYGETADGEVWKFTVETGWRRAEECEEFSKGAFEENYSEDELGTVLVGYEYKETLYDNMFDAGGREFFGWTTRPDGSGILYHPGEALRITSPVTLYAKWGGAQKKVVYLPNGGVGVMKDDVYDVSVTSVVLKKNNPPYSGYARNGYEFVGWSYKEDGIGAEVIGDGATVVIGAGTTKLYAQWNPVTYIVRVGSEDVRVEEQSFCEYILGLNETLDLSIREDKKLAVFYDLNDKETQPAMQGKAEFLRELTKKNTEAFLEFYGWHLYEDVNKDDRITEVDRYVGYYEPNSSVKNLATKKDAVFYVFPYWGGSASYVQLPEIVCDGYVFVGYTPGTAYAPDSFKTPELYVGAIRDNVLIPAPIGSGALYQPKADGEVLYAYYEREMQEGEVYGFEVYDVFGSPAWEELQGTEQYYTIGIQEETQDIWDTLPLRNGVHPFYRNLGGLPKGGGFSFRVISTGIYGGENVSLTITPHLCPIGEEGYYDGDIYFLQETNNGSYLKKWKSTEQELVLYAYQDSLVAEDGNVRIWNGTFRVPEQLWLAESNYNVTDYQKQFGLNFEESFWRKDVRLMLCFTLCFEDEDGECLYYGRIQENQGENIWLQEMGEPYREDTDKKRYDLFGGEIAVIYPTEDADKWNCIYGIY